MMIVIGDGGCGNDSDRMAECMHSIACVSEPTMSVVLSG